MKSWLKWGTAAIVVVALGALSAQKISQRRAAAAQSAVAPAPTALELSRADLLTARPLELTRAITVSGGLKAVNTAVVKARIAAEIKSLTVREGDTVKAGQVIGQLDTSEFDLRLRQAEQTAASANAQLDIAVRALDNNRKLVAQGFISSTGLETTISNEAAARATWAAAAAATDLARKSRTDAALIAPITGVVSQRLAQPGERVGIEAKLIEIVDLTRIELEAAVAPEDVGSVRIGQRALLAVDGLAPGTMATVARINPSTQAGTRAVMVYLALQPQAGLRQGLFATGTIDLQRQTTLALPLSAVRIDQARPYVLAVEGDRVAQRSVTLGMRGQAIIDGQAESAVAISAGLEAGATVLRSTTGAVRDGTLVKIAGAPQ